MNWSTLEVLKAGKKKLTPTSWCQKEYAFATNDFGIRVKCHPAYHLANEWCAYGSVMAQQDKVASHSVVTGAMRRLNDAANKLFAPPGGKTTLPKVNDAKNCTLAMIHAIYDEAIAAENLYLKEGRDI